MITIPILKNFCLVFSFLLTAFSYAQRTVPMSQASSKRTISMSNATGNSSDGVYRYYAKGEGQPFTGVLFAKFPNGNYSSWQEYENGLGQGKWINYYENGNYKEIGHYNSNRVEGPIKKFYENGTMKAKGNYKDWRIKIGQWEYFDKNGILTSTVDYGEKGSIEEVQDYYDRGDISYSWYVDILTKNGFN